MMRGRSSVLAWTAVATLSVATIGSTTTEARDFNWSKYCPSSIRSKIEAYVSNRVSSARPKDEEILPTQAGKDHATAPRNPATAAASTVSTTAVAGGKTCLMKQYLATGAVLFKDACTKEWAINSTGVASRTANNRNCLTKDSRENGFVMFKDICTNEWAMNTLERKAEPPESW
jgi:hypothetical protein